MNTYACTSSNANVQRTCKWYDYLLVNSSISKLRRFSTLRFMQNITFMKTTIAVMLLACHLMYINLNILHALRTFKHDQ